MKLSMSVFLSFFLIFMACSGDDDDVDQVACAGNNVFVNEAFVEAYGDLIDAGSAYGQNATPENCEAYKQAIRDYIDVAESLRNCAIQYGQIEDFDEDIEEAREDVEELEC